LHLSASYSESSKTSIAIETSSHRCYETEVQAIRKDGPEAVEQAVRVVADAIGELMEFWNFKPSMGRVWAVLYLSPQPLAAEDICAVTGLSAGSVSMTLNELRLWGVVRKVVPTDAEPGRRKKLYRAETDIWAMVTRVFRERELRQVEHTVRSLIEAISLLEDQGASSSPEDMLRRSFVLSRVRKLLELAETGERIIRRLGDSGELDLSPIRHWLGQLRRRGT